MHPTMASLTSLPLHEKIQRNNTLQRLSDIVVVFLLLSLLLHRLLHFSDHGFVWRLAFLCELWFTFVWVLIINSKWNLVDCKTHPQRLLQRFHDLPAVDMFVTTADCMLEPPIITVNTVLSLLAVDYPPNKLSCYVSDDGCSPITYYSLVEASKFAKMWVPFCKKYGIQVRAPALYFSAATHLPEQQQQPPSDFLDQWRRMKEEYEQLGRKIQDAVQNSVPCHLDEDFADFQNIEQSNDHPSIIKVIWKNNKDSSVEHGVPHLVYVAREKRPKKPHNFKAGAMNVLARVSGVMTNAPFMLNVDCDMLANNSQIVVHAMCLLLGVEKEREYGFVQSPQLFHGGLEDDPFGNDFLLVLHKVLVHGLVANQGPFYEGTGCFHRRKIIYGSHPEDEVPNGLERDWVNAESDKGALQRRFGCSKAFLESVTRIMQIVKSQEITDLSSTVEAAKEVAGCSYEHNTCWGNEVGLVYGCPTEDINTGLKIHSMGWSSAYCSLDPPAFLGLAPSNSLDYIIQQKRWGIGLLEILIGKNSPVLCALRKKLQFRQSLIYIWVCIWPLRSLPELCYAMLPAIALLTNTPFMPKASEPAVWVIATLFIFYNLYTLTEFRNCGLSVRSWWNNQRMRRITSASSWLFAVLSVLLKLLGLSETIFELTRKDQNAADSGNDSNTGRFTFNSSPLFLPGTTLMLVQMMALVRAFVRGYYGSRIMEMVCILLVLLNFLPLVKGLFCKGSYGIPWSTVCKAAALACIIVRWCI